MVKMPPATEHYVAKLRESQEVLKRLENGNSLLLAEYQKGSMAQCFKVINQWITLSQDMVYLMEEMALIHQFLATGTKFYVQRQGKPIFVEQFIAGEDIEIDGSVLLMLVHLKEVFGEVPWEMLSIKE